VNAEEAKRIGAHRKPRQTLLDNQIAVFRQRCEEVATSINLRLQRADYRVNGLRDKRDGGIWTNLILISAIEIFKSKIFPNHEVDDLKNKLNNALLELRRKTTVQSLITKMQLKNQANIETQVEKLAQNLAQLPSLEMTTEYLVSELEHLRALLDRLFISIQEEKPDGVTMAQVFNTTIINNFEVRDIAVNKVSYIGFNTVRFNLHGHIRSKVAKVYRVHAFTHYTNLTACCERTR
jgi:hypothetical protein